jgi:hypothetical protein
MALRVAEPLPLRTLGIAAVALGALIVEAAAASRPSAIVGLVLIALGAVLLDGVRDRRLTPRHVGLFSLLVGASLSSWTAIVLVVMALFDLDPGGHLVMLLSVGAVGAATGIVLLRRPVTEEASDRSAGRANSKGRTPRRYVANRLTAPLDEDA